ncbi:MAG: cob(I)yrinic acid a,c-diamide adenosyltransferase, partial [Dermatophilaceae bacterium]
MSVSPRVADQPNFLGDEVDLTTRQRRNRPLLLVHTGDGKGKSMGAFGLALRGWTQGWDIG